MSSLRRLAKDHAFLRASLPPNYLFPQSDDADSLPDDLTQLVIHLTGSEGTPYSAGLWLLHLRIPHDYPKSPPKASFRTRIFHPNVEETTGAVCLETLKRDWDPKLTLKDILVTISCLLIQPNPDSALNEKAGVLVREDYDGFVRQAKLMTRIHAPIPANLKESVDAARSRGEEDGKVVKRVHNRALHTVRNVEVESMSSVAPTIEHINSGEASDSAKENGPSPAITKPPKDAPEPKKHALGKRSLAELHATPECEDVNILQAGQVLSTIDHGEPLRKSPKHTHQSQANGKDAKKLTLMESILPLDIMSVPEDTVSLSVFTMSSQQEMNKPSKRSKYRTYARIGIKRL